MQRLMIIRHAEKPSEGPHGRGVSFDGDHDKHELTIRGWQRAGALVRFFAPCATGSTHPLISEPRAIFAAAAVRGSPSVRSQHTVEPLAEMLGLAIRCAYAEDQEVELAAAMLAAPSPVLVAWHHKHIPPLVRALAGEDLVFPARWPDARFDVVWVLDRDGADAPWRFAQVTQNLLPGDRQDPIGPDEPYD